MAFTNLLSFLAFATCALIVSNPTPANALSIDKHHIARHAVHDTIVRKRRSTNSGRCKPRPTTSAAAASTDSTSSKPTSTPSAKISTGSGSSGDSGSNGSSGDSSGDSSGSSGNSGSSSSSSNTPAPSQSNSGGLQRGLGWAVDNTYADGLNPSWYFHWAQGPVPQLSGSEFVPQLWGSSQMDAWNSVVATFQSVWPKHMIGPNEPDIPSQANMSPQDAADLWIQQIQKYANQGVSLVSPCIAFDVSWLQSFVSAISVKGGHVDKICLHWYGGHDDTAISQLKSYVQSARNAFPNNNIWITEIGLTQESDPSPQDALGFAQQMIGYFESLGYVERIAWFGSFQQSNPIDGFAAANNAFFYGPQSYTPLGSWYLDK